MRTTSFGINAMLADMEPLLRRITGSQIDLAYRQAAGLWPVQTTPGKLEEVLLALAIDACDAMGEQGVLRVETGNVASPKGLPAGDYVMLTVSDSARGVADALREAVRGRGTRAGLGVRLGVEIAETAGGRLDVAPSTGGGLSVQLILPRAPGAAPAAPVDAATLRGASGETILVVEDDNIVMAATSQVLTRLGYSVLPASSAEAALRQLGQHPGRLDLLLTDIVLPGMDGLRLAREARAKRPGLKVLYMSGYSEEALRLKHTTDPDVPLVEKPFTFEGLARAVRGALG